MIEFQNLLPYDIRLSGSANKGFILIAGCCTCVFTDLDEALDAIREYVEDPKKMEAKYNAAMKHARPQVEETGVEQCMDTGPDNMAMPDPGCDCRR
jgi:hypothetical protein